MNILNKYTAKTLSKNKTRTLVTIIGIVLSVAMITAVTTFISSLQKFLVDTVIANDGNWHSAVFNISKDRVQKVKEDKETVNVCAAAQDIGYVSLENCQNADKPYLYVEGIDNDFESIMPVNLTDGRMPQNTNEIILPKHLASNGGIIYSLGDTITFNIGDRISDDGNKLTQSDYYLGNSSTNGDGEKLVTNETRIFTVVGFYERPNFENYNAPGYTALTVYDPSATYENDIYINYANPKDYSDYINENFKDCETSTNTDLLRFLGASHEETYNKILYSMAGILIAIIMFASVSLIYNAFSISVSERTKQFGLISSIGATKRQLMHSVIFEAMYLSGIGIPIGILVGIGGIGGTLALLKGMFTKLFGANMNNTVTFHLSVSLVSVLTAVVIGIITVLISAYIPARRAVKISAIDAIRQTKDYQIKAKKVKTSKLIYKLFGFEGMIARKNFKRNKKKYRATVISLFMSIVLFISASSFSAYLNKSVKSLVDSINFDITYSSYTADQQEKMPLTEIYSALSSVNGVTKSSYSFYNYGPCQYKTEDISNDYIKYYKKYNTNADTDNGYINYDTAIYFIDDATYEAYLTENGYDKSVYMNTEAPVALAMDSVKTADNNSGKYYAFDLLKKGNISYSIKQQKELDGYEYHGTHTDDNGNVYYDYVKYNEQGGEENTLQLPESEAVTTINAKIGEIIKKPVYGTYSGVFMLIYPYSAAKTVLGDNYEATPSMYFSADNHSTVYETMVKVLEDKHIATDRLNDYVKTMEINRAMITIMNVFSYGFIILISLIAAANVFNTISTNISLRRREFAILKSIGMTKKGFNRMMNFECLLYGFKGLIYGIPVSIGVTYLIYRSILNGLSMPFFIPITAILLAVASVFLVVFATMIYSMSKIKKENTIDALKNENF